MLNLIQNYPDIFIQNKYLKTYQNLINKCLLRTIQIGVYYEKHHYVPKSILKNKNIVNLTAREHYIAHLLLTKCVNQIYRKKMVFAMTSMKFSILNKIRCNSKLYDKFQKEANKLRADYMTDRFVSQEIREKIRTTLTGFKHSFETKQKMSLLRKGKPANWSEERRIMMSKLKKGVVYGEETRRKQSISRLNRVKICCIYCGNLSEVGNHTRWHGNNCKKKPQA